MKSIVRKRILCLFLCLAVLMPCASALSESTKVTGYLLRLRDEASTDGKVIDAFPGLQRGKRYTINLIVRPTYLYMMSEPDLKMELDVK